MRTALVYDYLIQDGGAERALEVLCEMFPQAPIYTILYDKHRTHGRFKNKQIKTSFLNYFPGAKKNHRWFFPLMPLVVKRWDFSKFDLVISVSASFAKGIKIKDPTIHICYLLSPTRFLWDESKTDLKNELPMIFNPLASTFIKNLRRWDIKAAQKPDIIIAISKYIQQKIQNTYKRRVQKVIYPPVNISPQTGKNEAGGKYYILVSRLVPHKKIDIAIKACEKLGLNLKIIGTGRDEKRLKKLAKNHTEFLGELNDKKKNFYLAGAKAFLMPQVEDFGIAPIEALSQGTPVIAYGKGGALEILESGKNGVFFQEQTPESLIGAIKKFEQMNFDTEKTIASAQKFSKERFKKDFLEIVKRAQANNPKKNL